jgi:hypothetical protein
MHGIMQEQAILLELNYTPESEDGTIDPKKAISIAESFEVSRQFWSYLVNKRFLLGRIYQKYSSQLCLG